MVAAVEHIDHSRAAAADLVAAVRAEVGGEDVAVECRRRIWIRACKNRTNQP